MRRGARALALVLLLPLVGCGGDGWRREACAPAKPAAPGLNRIELQSAGMTRRAVLYVPESYDGTEQFPLVFNWHGYGSSAEEHLRYADMLPLADDERFLVVAPEGEGVPTRFNLGAGITGDTDDVQLAVDLIDRVEQDLCLDTRRVYSVGVSNGGGMGGVLACVAGSRFAAVGMVALELKPDRCTPPTPAIVAIQGDADLVVPFQGGRVNCCGGWPIAAPNETMQRWADELRCRDEDQDDVSEHVERTRWRDCDDGREVAFYVVRGGGHTWPGAAAEGPLGPTTDEISASEIMWDFFKRFTTR